MSTTVQLARLEPAPVRLPSVMTVGLSKAEFDQLERSLLSMRSTRSTRVARLDLGRIGAEPADCDLLFFRVSEKSSPAKLFEQIDQVRAWTSAAIVPVFDHRRMLDSQRWIWQGFSLVYLLCPFAALDVVRIVESLATEVPAGPAQAARRWPKRRRVRLMAVS